MNGLRADRRRHKVLQLLLLLPDSKWPGLVSISAGKGVILTIRAFTVFPLPVVICNLRTLFPTPAVRKSIHAMAIKVVDKHDPGGLRI
jgi:hypothetical protein